jgi:hypothetical protein
MFDMVWGKRSTDEHPMRLEIRVKLARLAGIPAILAAALTTPVGAQDEPWIITGPVVLTEPAELGHVIVAGNGSLSVLDVPEPGLSLRGHIWAIGNAEVKLERSVVQFMSEYHGQYALVGGEQARISVVDCDYRVPNRVQHPLMVVGNAEMLVEDTDFGDVQLLSAENATLEARRLNGHFEVLVQHDSTMVLSDIPRFPDQGSIWVWVEFPAGSVAEYTPPMPGWVESWSFPPAASSGIFQSVTVDRCEALLWPMLVREASDVTLRDIPEEHWVVVGFHMPEDAVVNGLVNDRFHIDHTLDLDDRTFRLINASVDTWNLYPQAHAKVMVRDSWLGEILSLERSVVMMERTTIDGTGGFFGARDTSRITASDCRFTCTVEATQHSTIELRSSLVEPYPFDPTGVFTRFGAYDNGRLLADQTVVLTTPALSGSGLIAVSGLREPPPAPPGPGESIRLVGTVAQFSLDPEVAAGSWRLEASDGGGGVPELIGGGVVYVEDDLLGTWSDADATIDHRLQTVLTDGLGRTLVGNLVVPGSGPRAR